MHIGFITPEYPNNIFKTNYGGIGTFTKNLADLLIKEKHHVSIFIHSQKENAFVVENGVQIHYVKAKKLKGFTWLVNRFNFNKYVNNQIVKNNIDVLEAPEWTGFTAFMKFKCPHVIRLHGSDTYFCNLENRKVKLKNKLFEKKALKGASKIVGVSHFVATKTKELFKINKTIKVIHNTVNVKLLKPDHSKIHPKTLLYFGTLIRKKGVFEIAQTFNKIIDEDDTIQLKMIGSDCIDYKENKSTLAIIKEKLSPQAKLNFSHENSLPYHLIIEEIKKAAIVLLPSFAEAFPMTWLEAMALEKKLITSNIGWAKELMIENVTGYVVNPIDSNDFANKVQLLLKDSESNKTMAKNARERIVYHFSIEKFIDNNIDFYKSVVEYEV